MKDESELEKELENADVTAELESEVVETEEGTETSSNEVETAKKHGHLSKDDYLQKHGSLDGYKSPEEFNKYGKAWEEVSDVIKGMKKLTEDQKKQIESLVKYNERIEEKAVQKAREQLESQLREAKELGDVVAVEQLTREKAKAEFNTAQGHIQRQEQECAEVTKTFMERNKHWLNINTTMTARAQHIDAEERAKAQSYNIPLTYQQLSDVVEARLRVEFPDVMIASTAGNTAPNLSSTQSAVNKSGVNVNSDHDKVFNSLSQEHKAIFKSLSQHSRMAYSKKEFVERLRKDGEI